MDSYDPSGGSYWDCEGCLRTCENPSGTVDNVMRAHSLRPHTMVGHLKLYRSVLHHPENSLPSGFWRLLAYTPACSTNVSSYTHHFANMQRLLEDPQRSKVIEEALRDQVPERAFTGKELALIRYTGKLTLTPGKISEQDLLMHVKQELLTEKFWKSTKSVHTFVTPTELSMAWVCSLVKMPLASTRNKQRIKDFQKEKDCQITSTSKSLLRQHVNFDIFFCGNAPPSSPLIFLSSLLYSKHSIGSSVQESYWRIKWFFSPHSLTNQLSEAGMNPDDLKNLK